MERKTNQKCSSRQCEHKLCSVLQPCSDMLSKIIHMCTILVTILTQHDIVLQQLSTQRSDQFSFPSGEQSLIELGICWLANYLIHHTVRELEHFSCLTLTSPLSPQTSAVQGRRYLTGRTPLSGFLLSDFLRCGSQCDIRLVTQFQYANQLSVLNMSAHYTLPLKRQ